MGRRSHKPDAGQRRQVEAMAACGVPEADIGRVIGIDAKTLRKHYRDQLDTGQIKANARIAESLYRKALGDGTQSVTAAIFWLKTRARWKETSVTELAAKDREPITVIVRTIYDPHPENDRQGLPTVGPAPVLGTVIEHEGHR